MQIFGLLTKTETHLYIEPPKKPDHKVIFRSGFSLMADMFKQNQTTKFTVFGIPKFLSGQIQCVLCRMHII